MEPVTALIVILYISGAILTLFERDALDAILWPLVLTVALFNRASEILKRR